MCRLSAIWYQQIPGIDVFSFWTWSTYLTSFCFPKDFAVRILHLIASLDLHGGGPAEVVRLQGKAQAAMGHCVEAASADGEAVDVSSFSFPVHRLGPGNGYAYSRRLAKWLKQNRSRFDVVLVHGLWQYPQQAAYTLLRGHVPYFVYTHGMLDPWFNQSFRMKHMKKLIYWHCIGRRALDAAAAVLFTTDEELLRSSRSFFPYHWQAIVSPLGVEGPQSSVDATEMYAKWPQLRDREYLLFFGRLHVKKGCDLLLKAFARSEAHTGRILVMAGPGELSYEQELQKLATSLGISKRVVWAGMVQGEQKWAMLQQADAFILPSHQENFAMAAVEAMCCGTPVLLSEQVQIQRDVVREGAGFAEPDTLEGTTRLLNRWRMLSDQDRTAMRLSARKAYTALYTVDSATAHLMQQMAAVLRRQQRQATEITPIGPSNAVRQSGT